jgi:hypothetical protein
MTPNCLTISLAVTPASSEGGSVQLRMLHLALYRLLIMIQFPYHRGYSA